MLAMRSLLVIFSTIGLAQSATFPRKTLVNGVVEGFCLIDSPVQVNAFLGVPFAEPPVRFEKPLPKNNWSGVLATKTQPNMCTQVTGAANSEDCLYLNVYAPAVAPSAALNKDSCTHGLPVFVVVHGGAFATGSAQEGAPEHIARYLAAKGIVVVAIQYRVGPLGFCTTKDSAMPGNYGMWDAKIAFEWVRDNIAAFGGNPNDVTAYGGSAGAALIDGMHLSPLTTSDDHLFHKMVLFSGAARDMWDAHTTEHCEERATAIGLSWTDSASFKSALLSANAADLAGGWQVIGEENFDYLLCGEHGISSTIGNADSKKSTHSDWAPVLDGDFFPSTPAAMRAATQPKPSIFGNYFASCFFGVDGAATQHKPSFFGISFLEGAGMSGAITIDHTTVEKIVDFMVPATIANRSLFQSYFLESYRNQGQILEPTAIDKHAMMAVNVFKHFNPAPIGGLYPFISYATHSFDQWYSLGLPGFTLNTADQIVIDIYTTALVNFAKTGNPNGSSASALPVPWVAATAQNPSLNYVIETTPSMDAQFFYGRPNLNNILNKIGGTFKPV
ncbi:hypothetical protein PRIPAC_89993 [Pristionchus pacificus]|uniref:Hydrolase n=1 Tax=Pristionchus pacificus TaxID=54126 RepID=A0A2A6B6U7_PRIPA|nr:hypothetical protein PRIPAC_89993 [Pristionchus pacificus]|eukprot:PDM61597.1 hydrolase [Pristionchus pacificus]